VMQQSLGPNSCHLCACIGSSSTQPCVLVVAAAVVVSKASSIEQLLFKRFFSAVRTRQLIRTDWLLVVCAVWWCPQVLVLHRCTCRATLRRCLLLH